MPKLNSGCRGIVASARASFDFKFQVLGSRVSWVCSSKHPKRFRRYDSWAGGARFSFTVYAYPTTRAGSLSVGIRVTKIRLSYWGLVGNEEIDSRGSIYGLYSLIPY